VTDKLTAVTTCVLSLTRQDLMNDDRRSALIQRKSCRMNAMQTQ